MSSIPNREALFISHANPEDNAFTRWLGAKLAAMGYEVWADIMRLHGGADWARELEDALRHRAIKMLLVCTQAGLDKQGVRNEIEIATQVSKKIGDSKFIIPLRLEDFEAPFRIVHAQYLNFSSWASGLAELLELLAHEYKVPTSDQRKAGAWMSAHRIGAKKLERSPEPLTSNWLSFNRLPKFVRYCEPLSGLSSQAFQNKELYQWPIVPFNKGVLTFASPNSEGQLGEGISACTVDEISTQQFLDDGWGGLQISRSDARNYFVDLSNQAVEKLFQHRGLDSIVGATGKHHWFGTIKTAPHTKVRFNWSYQHGSRQIIGASAKRRVHWHYALNPQVRISPLPHLRLSARLIFSENGVDALRDADRMHRLRRSFAKSWRNARWRDMLLAFLWWFSGGRLEMSLEIADDQQMVIALPPMRFPSQVSILDNEVEFTDEDDPDIEMDYWDEDELTGDGNE